MLARSVLSSAARKSTALCASHNRKTLNPSPPPPRDSIIAVTSTAPLEPSSVTTVFIRRVKEREQPLFLFKERDSNAQLKLTNDASQSLIDKNMRGSPTEMEKPSS